MPEAVASFSGAARFSPGKPKLAKKLYEFILQVAFFLRQPACFPRSDFAFPSFTPQKASVTEMSFSGSTLHSLLICSMTSEYAALDCKTPSMLAFLRFFVKCITV